MDPFIESQANSQNYQHNLDLFADKDSLSASQIRFAAFNQIHFCQTEKGELNLYRAKYGITDYYHDQAGALNQAKTILEEKSLKKTDLVCFYGLGLGYVYDALKEWLRKNPSRQLIFLEDDLEVVHCFFYTSRATEVLNDPQVILCYFSGLDYDILKLSHLVQGFFPLPFRFYSLTYYTFRYYKKAYHLCYTLLYLGMLTDKVFGENLSGQRGFLVNLYSNLLSLPQSHFGSDLADKFKDIPAIICGAGPSLEKNIELLKTLKNRALIFAGGSSLNAVNSFGLMPHLGAGIDPNPEQYHRLLTNDTFHLPLFYRHRIAHKALQLIQGPKLYVSGSMTLASWFEEELGIPRLDVQEGHNVVNFCLEIARILGCNPIIMVGMDLAFTNVKTYASGIQIHPLWLGVSDPYAQESDKEVVVVRKDLHTKWEWIVEADWISGYAVSHPEIAIFNATEGGIGFPPVPMITLEEAANHCLTKTYDFDGWIHAEMQAHHLTLQRQQIIDKINEFKKSLESCMNHCGVIVAEGKKLLEKTEEKTHYTQLAILHESLLHEEIAYQHHLKTIDEVWGQYQKSKSLGKKLTPQESLNVHLKRYEFLNAVIEQHIQVMKQSVMGFILSAPPPHHKTLDVTQSEDLSTYQLDGDALTIVDPELELDIHEKAEVLHHTDKDEDGNVRWDYFRAGQELHGPSRFLSKNGDLLSESWFLHGKQIGKSRQYYASGRLYGLRRYRHGEPDGKQEYYFENGQLNTVFSYKGGRLEGAVCLYSPDGVLIRELHYREGKRHGTERLWDHRRTLLMECEYKDGIPTARAFECNLSGQIQKEVTIHNFPKDFDVSEFDPDGQLLLAIKHGIEDFTPFFAQREKEVQYMEEALKTTLQQAKKLLKDSPLAKEWKDIDEAVKKIEKMRDDLEAAKKVTLENAETARKTKANT